MLNELIDRAARRRDHSRSLAARLANLQVRDTRYLTSAEQRIRENKLTKQELEPFLCWEDLAHLACENQERITAAGNESTALTSSLQATQKLLEEERAAKTQAENRRKDLVLEMEALRLNVAVAQQRESDLETSLSALRERYTSASSVWRADQETAQRKLALAAAKEQELRSELVMALDAHHPPTAAWRLELDNTRQDLEATKRALVDARRVIHSLRQEESQPAARPREENMRTVGRGFPVFTPSPASGAMPDSMSTADIEVPEQAFPTFEDLSPPMPKTTDASSSRSSTLPGREEGEISEESAFSQKPRERVRRVESSSMGIDPPPARQESSDQPPGVTSSPEQRHHNEGASQREQQGYEARSHYGPGSSGSAGFSSEASPPTLEMRPPSRMPTGAHAGTSLPPSGLSSQTLSSPSRVHDQTLTANPALVVPGSMKKVMLESLEIVDLRKFRESSAIT